MSCLPWKKKTTMFYSERFSVKKKKEEEEKKPSIYYLCFSMATSIKPNAAYHQRESSQLFLIGNERQANYNSVDEIITAENMRGHLIRVMLQLWPN